MYTGLRAWGTLTDEIEEVIEQYVEGKEVWDLGAGNMTLSRRLLDLGASKVIAVEPKDEHVPDEAPPGVERRAQYIHEVEADVEEIEVALLSWPQRNMKDLIPLLERTKVVMYLGSNFDGSSCGDPLLFSYLLRREVLEYVPYWRNSLLVYGDVEEDETGDLLCARKVYAEEYASMSTLMLRFDELPEEPMEITDWVRLCVEGNGFLVTPSAD